MSTSIFILATAQNPGGHVKVGVNGVVVRLQVGVDVVVGDDVLEVLNRTNIKYRLSSTLPVSAGATLISSTGSRIRYGVNGVVGSLPVNQEFTPSADVSEAIDHSNVFPFVSRGPTGVTPLSISGSPPSATVGSAYSFTPTTANGSGTKTFAYTGTSLASFGLSFNTTTGAITGTVSGSAGTITGTITVTDTTGHPSLAINIVVSAAASSLNALTWPWADGYVFENSAAAVLVGTPVGKTSGSTLSIVGVTLNDGTTAAPAGIFQIIGSALYTGATAIDYEAAASGQTAPAYLVTIRETLGGVTLDTVMPVLPVDVPEAGSLYSDDFSAYASGTPLRTLAGWTGSGTVGNQDSMTVNASHQLNVPTSPSYTLMRQAGGTDVKLTFKPPTAGTAAGSPSMYVRYTSGTNYIAFTLNSSGRSLVLKKRSTTTGALVTLFTYTPNTGAVIDVGATLGLIVAGGRAWTLYNNVIVGDPTGYDVSDVPVVDNVGFISDANNAGSLIDDISIQAITAFSVSGLQKVYAYDPATGFATVPLCGGYVAASPPSAIEWRLETEAGVLVTGYDWQALGATIANGVWSKVIQIPKASSLTNYIIRVRDASNPTTVLAASGVFGVGLIVAPYGQSNMARMSSTPGATITDANPGKAWSSNASGISTFTALATNLNNNAVAGMTNTLVSLFSVPVMILNGAQGGHSAAALSPSGDGSYQNFISMIRLYGGGRVSAFICDQGEQDAGQMGHGIGGDLQTPASWVTQWAANYAALCASIGRPQNVPWTWALSLGQNDTTASTADLRPAGYINIRKAQNLLHASIPMATISHHKFDIDYDTGENIHQAMTAQAANLGPRFAWSLAKRFGLQTYDRNGPRITGVSRSGAVLTFTVDKNGASSLTDNDATNIGTLVNGWLVVNAPGFNGSQDPESYLPDGATTGKTIYTVSSVTYSDVASTITVTLSADPGGPVAIAYPRSVLNISGTNYFDGSQPFGLPYGTTGQQSCAQIKGVYAEQNVGLQMFSAAAV